MRHIRQDWKSTLGAGVLAAALVFTSGACTFTGLLEVEDPDIIEPDALNNLQGADATYLGALADFTLAKDGGNGSRAAFQGGIGILQAGGWFTDEFRFGGTPPSTREMDLRNVQTDNPQWGNVYLLLHRARIASIQGADRLIELVATPAADSRIGELYAIAAYSVGLLGENYCSGVPFGTQLPEIVNGTPETTTQIFDRGLSLVALAEGFTAGDAAIANLVAVTKGRLLLNQGMYAAAATAVAAVPTSFAYFTFHSVATARQENRMFDETFAFERLAVSDNEAINGLNFATANDPRVPVIFPDVDGDGIVDLSVFDRNTPMYQYAIWNSNAVPVLTSDGFEARMIEAEAALQAGGVAAWLGFLNAARADAAAPAGLGVLVDPGTAAGRVDLMFRERAFWMFATGHRVGDFRRLSRQYGRDPETVWPTGPYHKDNLTIGTLVNLPIPDSEMNNPNSTGCIDLLP